MNKNEVDKSMKEEKQFIKNRNVRMAISISLNIVFVLIAVYLIYGVGAKAFRLGEDVFNEQSVDPRKMGREVEVTLAQGETSDKSVAHILYEKGLVKDENVCYIQIFLSEYKGKFLPGTYVLSTEMKPSEMMEILAKPKEPESSGEG